MLSDHYLVSILRNLIVCSSLAIEHDIHIGLSRAGYIEYDILSCCYSTVFDRIDTNESTIIGCTAGINSHVIRFVPLVGPCLGCVEAKISSCVRPRTPVPHITSRISICYSALSTMTMAKIMTNFVHLFVVRKLESLRVGVSAIIRQSDCKTYSEEGQHTWTIGADAY